jgi:mannose-6-phosphate isomerase-like protein (cupin superfamily)
VSEDPWRIFHVRKLLEQQQASDAPYHEFLRRPSMSCGIYTLAAGAKDLQGPHDEDEVYYVVAGKARLRVDGDEQTVQAGSILYVRATSEHSFFEIEEDVTLLVFFASGGPAE